MFPIDRIKELVIEGFIDSFATNHYSFMGGGGNQKIYSELTGPQIARLLKKDNVDAVVLTAGWGTCHRTTTIVQRAIEESGIPTILIAALPPVAKQSGTPRAVAPMLPIGANAGEPNNPEMQGNILRDTLLQLTKIKVVGEIVLLPYIYVSSV